MGNSRTPLGRLPYFTSASAVSSDNRFLYSIPGRRLLTYEVPPQTAEACPALLVATPTALAGSRPTPRIAAQIHGREGRGEGRIQEALCRRLQASPGPFGAWQVGWCVEGPARKLGRLR